MCCVITEHTFVGEGGAFSVLATGQFRNLMSTPTTMPNKKKKTPLGGRKRRRKEHCKKMTQTRWQSSTEAGQDHAEKGQQNDQCAARRKLDLMHGFIDAADDTNNDMERCFMEFGCLKALLSVVTCQCGGNIHIQFCDKMGYSRQIRLACQVCNLSLSSLYSKYIYHVYEEEVIGSMDGS